MALTTTSTLPPAVQAYYDKRFLLRAKPQLQFQQFGQKRQMPGGVGKTVYFSRYIPRNAATTALTETTDGGITTTAINSEEISTSVALYGDWTPITQLATLTAIDDQKDEKVNIMADQAALTVDTLVRNAVLPYINRMRADNDPAYTISGIGSAAGTTTTLVDTNNLTQANDFWNGGFIAITAGTNYGEVRQITDFVNSTGTLTFAAMGAACDTTSKYHLVVGTGLSATDVLSTGNIRLARRELKRAKSLVHSKGYFVGILDEDTEYDFMGDDAWVKAATYKDSVDALYEGEVGKWLGIRFVGTNNGYRESVAGVQGTDAAVHVIPIFGAECYGVVDLEGQPKKIYVKSSEQLAQPIPLYGSIGWEVGMGKKALNGVWGCGIMCGATA